MMRPFLPGVAASAEPATASAMSEGRSRGHDGAFHGRAPFSCDAERGAQANEGHAADGDERGSDPCDGPDGGIRPPEALLVDAYDDRGLVGGRPRVARHPTAERGLP